LPRTAPRRGSAAQPKFFAKSAEFRRWLEVNHGREKELVVGFHKVDSGKPSMTWSQSVDEALCFGWIDGVRKSRDATSYTIRFTPRRKSSAWSAINIAKVAALKKAGRMTAVGLAAFEQRNRSKDQGYSYERETAGLSSLQQRSFESNTGAWTFFRAQAPSYQRTSIFWVLSAKQEATRASRLARLIAASAKQKRLI
jgi:uncharacterized protein YdeI (YjbR/CyaY-like superfamily)